MGLFTKLWHLNRAGFRVEALGPIFLSYRQDDGTVAADRLAWALRAGGVPVWHDVADLPPGDTTRRLDEALSSGLSGCVLVVSPNVRKSKVIRKIELPRLISLERTSEFIFVIANLVSKSNSAPDYLAPDRLLRKRKGTLSRIKQYPAGTDEEVGAIAREIALQRMAHFRSSGNKILTIDLQTRSTPRASAIREALVVRTHPPEAGHRVPPRSIWSPLRDFLSCLPRFVAESGAREVEVTGGGHLSVAFALGAALPSTSTWSVTVVDQQGKRWDSRSDAKANELVHQFERFATDLTGIPVAVFVDLVATPPPEDTFREYARAGRFSGILEVMSRDRLGLDAEQGNTTAVQVADLIRDSASEAASSRIALFLRCPFPIAVLLGRLLNTLEVELFEWENSETPTYYVPTVVVASGRGTGPIVSIPSSS